MERPLKWRSLAPVAAVAAAGYQLLPGRRRAAACLSWYLLVRYRFDHHALSRKATLHLSIQHVPVADG